MVDKDTMKSYLKANVDNFKNIDFSIKQITTNKNEINVEATVYNFSQFHSVYVTVDSNKFELFKYKLKQSLWNNHKSFFQYIQEST